MVEVDIDRELAALGLSARWVVLGVVGAKHLDPAGVYRMNFRPNTGGAPPITGQQVVESALFSYLQDRLAIDDATAAELLELASRISTDCSRTLADWDGLSHGQLARIAGDRSTSPEIRRLAGQKLRVMTLASAVPSEVDLLGLQRARQDDPPAFAIRMFQFTTAWQRRLSDEERNRVAALLTRLPRDEQMKCHMPAFGLRIATGGSDAFMLSICFECNNIFLDGGGVFMFDGQSPPAVELLRQFISLSPSGWPSRR